MKYRTRPVRYEKMLASGGWRLKLYSISVAEQPRREFIEAAEDVAFEGLPEPSGEGRHGVGFVIAHDGEDGCWTLVDWWQHDDILYQNLYRASKDKPRELAVNTEPGPVACVWELEVINFERRAWMDTVLKNPAGPDIESYVGSSFNSRI